MATNEPPAPEGNLISNGTFEDPDKDTYLESNYDPWGRGNTNFYTGGNAGKSGGYAITDNAKTFWHDYQDITAHEGTYFGLFDSKIYDGSEQAAWIARSGSNNPNLKVQKGVSYLFSFWVANINTYDQMDNGARLQFQISYNGGSTWTNLGHEINLKNFKDHNWHGRSSIATPDETSENVVIRVINLNQSDQNIGNDFALDDIRFEAVTSHSSNIAAYERFPVKYLKCEITGATFEQPLSCDVTKADVNYTITFVHPRGDLYIFEKNADETLTPLAHILHSDIGDETTSYTGVLKDQPVDNKNHDLIVYFDDGNVCSKDPKSYSYYSHATPTISIESLTWGTVSCDIPTVSLTAVINYTNQNGTLTAKADGIDANPAPIYTSIESDTPDQVTLTFPGLTADGKTGHKLFVNFDGSHGCSINYDIPEHAPYMPKIISTAAEVQPYKCGDEKYKVKITVNYTNSQDSDLVITDEAGNEKILKAAEYGATEASYTFEMPWEYPVSEHTFKAFFVGAQQCKDEPSHLCTYTAPAKPTISADSSYKDMDCDLTTYTLQLDLTYTNQKGTKFYASVDGGAAIEVANPNPGAQTEKSDVTLNITGLLADGKKDHTYRIWTDNTDDCELNITYEASFAPVISNIEATPKQMACDITKYDVVVTFDVTNGQDSMVTVWGKEQSKTFVAVEGKNTVTFKDIETDAEKDYFDIWFENANNCNHKRTIEYKEPVTPHIELTNGPAIGETACDKTTYTVKCDVTHINQNGKLFAWIDSNSKQEFSYDKNPVTIAFTDLPGDGLEHTFNIEFDGEHSCNLTQDFKAPFAPTISNVTATPAQMGCDITKYNVTVDFVVTNGQSKEVTVQGKGQTKTFTANEGDNSVTFEEIDTNTDDDFFEVWFEEAENATDKCKKKVSYTEPVTPTIYVPDAEFNTPSCTDVTTTLTFDLEYTYQQGKLYYNVDGLPDSIKDITPNSSLITLTGLKYEGVPADGKNDHVLNIVFDGENSCRESFGLQRAPFAPVIKGVVVGEPKYKCGDDKYEIELTISYANGLNRTIYINEGSTELAPITTDNDADSHTAEPVVLKLDFDAAHHLNVFFDGYKTACPNAINIPSVAKPSLGTIKVNNATPCDGTTFDVEVEVQNFVNQDGTLTISIDEETVTSTDFTTNSATPQTKAITISGLKADISNTSHSLNVAFVGGSHGCSYSETIDIPVNPKLIGDTTAYYCFGTSFEWHGVDYKASDPAPTHTYTSNVTGCDSIVTLRLTELPELKGDTTAYYNPDTETAFIWHGSPYTKDDPAPTHNYYSKRNTDCDSIVTLHVKDVLHGDTTAFVCHDVGSF
ncbi:MAG: hypothetical protein IKP57_06760, partial [Paludibacteraceae bacterium]|nr:hypothetical protein [Paludibacteraceae bacterium]